MKGTTSDTAPSGALGIRVAVGLAGMMLLALFILMGHAATRQSATMQALDDYETTGVAEQPAAVE